MAPATPTCQLSLKQELKGAQRVWNSYHLLGGFFGGIGDRDSGNKKGREWVLEGRQAAAPG